MINIDDFTNRLQKVISYYGLSASSFADKVGVQRSSISHILSGRNNPSLDFIMKTLQAFPDVELYWLLNGKGDFPIKKENPSSTKEIYTSSLFDQNQDMAPKIEQKVEKPMQIPNNSDIDRIVIFYNDGTFETYRNK